MAAKRPAKAAPDPERETAAPVLLGAAEPEAPPLVGVGLPSAPVVTEPPLPPVAPDCVGWAAPELPLPELPLPGAPDWLGEEPELPPLPPGAGAPVAWGVPTEVW